MGGTIIVYRNAFVGGDHPSAPLDRMISPFSLRRFADDVEALRSQVRAPNVMIEGESGTGKELAADYVMKRLRPGKTYGRCNMANISNELGASELFGHERGAFSGATTTRAGFLAEHEDGAVFLDEIGETPLEVQAKLLRFMQEREIEPVGGRRRRLEHLLVVAGTNRAVDDRDAFRFDVMMRFDRARLRLPPLRERREDILDIAEALVRAERGTFDIRGNTEPQAVERMLLHGWQGNVRELESVVVRAFDLTLGQPMRLPDWSIRELLSSGVGAVADEHLRSDPTREHVLGALTRSANNKSQAARALGVSIGKFRRLLERHEIPTSSDD